MKYCILLLLCSAALIGCRSEAYVVGKPIVIPRAKPGETLFVPIDFRSPGAGNNNMAMQLGYVVDGDHPEERARLDAVNAAASSGTVTVGAQVVETAIAGHYQKEAAANFRPSSYRNSENTTINGGNTSMGPVNAQGGQGGAGGAGGAGGHGYGGYGYGGAGGAGAGFGSITANGGYVGNVQSGSSGSTANSGSSSNSNSQNQNAGNNTGNSGSSSNSNAHD
jgi:hypothetical protein